MQVCYNANELRPTLTNLATLLRAQFSATAVKRIIVGQDNEPKIADLPQIQLIPESTNVALSGTAKDIQTRNIRIRAIVSVKANLNQTAGGLDTVSSMLAVVDLMEKKESSGAFSTASILGVLRNNPTVNDQQLFVDDMSVDYSNLENLGFPNATAEMSCVFTSRNLTK